MGKLVLALPLVLAACGQTPFVPKGDLASLHDLAGADLAGPHDLASSGGACPLTTLSSTLPVTYSGDTTGHPNLVMSPRLEWQDAPDDALLFVAPTAATYVIQMTAEPSSNQGFGVSAQDYNTMSVFDESTCPQAGAVTTLDGIFDGSLGSPGALPLLAGQHALLWVSAAYWSTPQVGPYSITISTK